VSAVAHIDEYKTGRFYTDEFRGLSSWNGFERNNLLRNEGVGVDGVPRFTDVAPSLGADDDYDARGIAIADFDNDGDLDIAVNHNPGDTGDRDRARPRLLINEIGDRHQWLAVELIGGAGNRDAIGARVVATSGDLRQLRQVDAGSSYAAQHSQRLYFGLGERTTVDSLEVRWPSGRTETVSDLAARTLVRITEGGGFEVGTLPGSEP
jgi:hypothetical protein